MLSNSRSTNMAALQPGSLGASFAAAIWAMSSSLGGLPESVASASRNMVLQNGQAGRDGGGSGGQQLLGPFVADAFAFFLAEKYQPAAGAAAERALARTLRFHQLAGLCGNRPRLVVDAW